MNGCTHSKTSWWLTIPVLFFLPFTALCIHLLGFKRIYAFAGRLAGLVSKWVAPSATPGIRAQQITQTVTLSNRQLSFYQAGCLAESLLLWSMLQSCGVDARIFLGVRTITGPLDAHAWVSYRNTVLNDIPSVHSIYAAFDLGQLTPGAGAK